MDSLFYVKTKISDECEVNTAITDENVFIQCAGCGVEEQVDISVEPWINIIMSDGINNYGTAIYCDKCSRKLNKGKVE